VLAAVTAPHAARPRLRRPPGSWTLPAQPLAAV